MARLAPFKRGDRVVLRGQYGIDSRERRVVSCRRDVKCASGYRMTVTPRTDAQCASWFAPVSTDTKKPTYEELAALVVELTEINIANLDVPHLRFVSCFTYGRDIPAHWERAIALRDRIKATSRSAKSPTKKARTK